MWKKLGGLLLVALLAAPAAGAVQTQAIRIGLAVGILGDISVYGDPIRNGFILAFRQINERSRALIDPILENTGDGSAGAVDAFRKFIQRDQVAAILGPVLSSQAFAADPLAVAAGVPVVGVSNTAEGIPEIGPTVFRVSAPESETIPKAIAMAKQAFSLQRVVVLFDNADDVTASGYRTFAGALQQNGIQIADTITIGRGDSDFSAQLTRAKAANPQAIVVSARAREGALLLTQARTLGITAPFIGGDGMNDPRIVSLARAAAEGLIVGTSWVPGVPSAVNLKFYNAYKDTYKQEPNLFAARAYAGAQVVGEAIRRSKLTGGEDIATQRARITEALKTIKNFETPLGRISITETRDVQQLRTYVAVVQGGRFVELVPPR